MSTALAPLGASGLLTLRDLIPRFLVWFKFVRQRASLTVDSYGFDLKTFLDFCDRAGLTRPDQVTFREVEMYLAWLRHERRAKPRTANPAMMADTGRIIVRASLLSRTHARPSRCGRQRPRQARAGRRLGRPAAFA